MFFRSIWKQSNCSVFLHISLPAKSRTEITKIYVFICSLLFRIKRLYDICISGFTTLTSPPLNIFTNLRHCRVTYVEVCRRTDCNNFRWYYTVFFFNIDYVFPPPPIITCPKFSLPDPNLRLQTFSSLPDNVRTTFLEIKIVSLEIVTYRLLCTVMKAKTCTLSSSRYRAARNYPTVEILFLFNFLNFFNLPFPKKGVCHVRHPYKYAAGVGRRDTLSPR